MNLLKKVSSCILISILLISFMSFVLSTNAYAEGEMPYVIVSSYEVSGGIIVPGEEFDITITVKNVDAIYTASNVIVSVEAINGISSIYPSVPQVFIGSVAPLEEKEASFSYKVDTQYQMDMAYFYTTIISDSNSNSVELSAPVELDDSAFTVLSKSVPDEAYAGDKISTSFYFRVRGETSLNNVLMRALVDGNETVSSAIGNVKQGASKTQNLVFAIDEVGKHNLVIEIEGINQDGKVQITEAFNGNIEVIESNDERIPEGDNVVVNKRAKRDYVVIGGALCLIVLFAGGILWVIRKNNRK